MKLTGIPLPGKQNPSSLFGIDSFQPMRYQNPMNVDRILDTMNKHGVEYLLLGGMNFLLRHEPVLTFDVDFWVNDTEENLLRCEKALVDLDAAWGKTDDDWGSVSQLDTGWLKQQIMFCTTSPYGAIDIFRAVKGLETWQTCADNAHQEQTSSGIFYLGISDDDMLKCQYALDENQRKLDRIRILEQGQESND